MYEDRCCAVWQHHTEGRAVRPDTTSQPAVRQCTAQGRLPFALRKTSSRCCSLAMLSHSSQTTSNISVSTQPSAKQSTIDNRTQMHNEQLANSALYQHCCFTRSRTTTWHSICTAPRPRWSPPGVCRSQHHNANHNAAQHGSSTNNRSIHRMLPLGGTTATQPTIFSALAASFLRVYTSVSSTPSSGL